MHSEELFDFGLVLINRLLDMTHNNFDTFQISFLLQNQFTNLLRTLSIFEIEEPKRSDLIFILESNNSFLKHAEPKQFDFINIFTVNWSLESFQHES
jgi:hypothetical protein